MSKPCIYNTYRDEDNVTYQIMAGRVLKDDEARRTIMGFLNKTSPKKRPNSGDIVILDKAKGQLAN